MRRFSWRLAASAFVWIAGLSVCDHALRAEEAADDAKAFTLIGRLVDADDKPVADGEVTLWKRGLEPAPHWTIATRPEIDSEGRFTLPGLESAAGYLLSVAAEGYAGVFKDVYGAESGKLDVKLVLKRPGSLAITVRDNAGQPVSGVQVRAIKIEDANGANWLSSVTLRDLQAFGNLSDEAGRLTLDGLPTSSLLEISLLHPDFVPVTRKDVPLNDSANEIEVELEPGIPITLQIVGDGSDPPIREVVIDLWHDPFDDASTLLQAPFSLDETGAVRLTVAAGRYSFFWLKHPDYLISPQLSPKITAGEFLKWADGATPHFEFAAHRKVETHGLAIDRTTGEPIANAMVRCEIPNVRPDGTVPDGESEWMHAGWGKTDDAGKYTLAAAAGPVRLWFEEQGYFSEEPYLEFTLDDEGTATPPPFEMTPASPVQGQVVGPDGTPASGIVVRFRGRHLRHRQPVLTDTDGRFTLEVPWIPVDSETQRNVLKHPIVAFAPHRSWAAVQWIDLSRPGDNSQVMLSLKDQPGLDLITMIPDELTKWEQREIDSQRVDELAATSLIDQPCPELDGRQWLNTPREQMSLEDYRGKHLLLVLWTTWCGPCHADFPSVELLRKLYGGDNFDVIGIHDNSVAPAEIAAHVKKEGLSFPIVIDREDGRIVKTFEAHGIHGYPSYILVGPDGRILMEDRTQPGPTLRVFKLELARQLILSTKRVGE